MPHELDRLVVLVKKGLPKERVGHGRRRGDRQETSQKEQRQRKFLHGLHLLLTTRAKLGFASATLRLVSSPYVNLRAPRWQIKRPKAVFLFSFVRLVKPEQSYLSWAPGSNLSAACGTGPWREPNSSRAVPSGFFGVYDAYSEARGSGETYVRSFHWGPTPSSQQNQPFH